MLSSYEGKERKAPLCPAPTSERPIRCHPGHQPGKVGRGRNPPREKRVLHRSLPWQCLQELLDSFSVGVVELNTFSFHFSNKKK